MKSLACRLAALRGGGSLVGVELSARASSAVLRSSAVTRRPSRTHAAGAAASAAARSAAPGLPARWRRTTSTSPMGAMASMANALPDTSKSPSAANASRPDPASVSRRLRLRSIHQSVAQAASASPSIVRRPSRARLRETRRWHRCKLLWPTWLMGGDLTKCSTSTSAGSSTARRSRRINELSPLT